MARKVGRQPKDKEASSGSCAGGYCEVCRINYNDVDEHIISNGHVKLVTDPTQYSHLDNIITQHSLGVGNRKKSLRISRSPGMGGKQSSPPPSATPHNPPVLNGHVTRSSKNFSPPAPIVTQQVECNGIGGTDGLQKEHNLRSTRSTLGRRGRVSRKRLSAEEKLIEDNKAYYKVEVLNSKLRSTGYMINSQRAEEEAKAVGTGDEKEDDRVSRDKIKEEVAPPVVVRFKKVRKSQLALLSDEAESFMFGERKSSSDEEEEEEKRDEYKKKRRTHAEAFIHDNLDYYKFVMSGSRLRSSGTCGGEVDDVKDPDVKPLNLEYGFEREWKWESWVQTYRRLDCGEEKYVRLHHDYPMFELPKASAPKKLGSPLGPRKPKIPNPLIAPSIQAVKDNRPRKSPRCHASTLAILSSLTSRRRRDPVFYVDEDSLPETILSSSSMGISDSGGGTSTPPPASSTPPYPELRGGNGGGATSPRMSLRKASGGFDRIAECIKESRNTWSGGMCLDVDPEVLRNQQVVSFAEAESGPMIEIEEMVNRCPEPWLGGGGGGFIGGNINHHHPSHHRLSDWGGTSCDGSECSDVLGFMDDGRAVRTSPGRGVFSMRHYHHHRTRKKRKKRNLTGWPLDKLKLKKKPKGLGGGGGLAAYHERRRQFFAAARLAKLSSASSPLANNNNNNNKHPPSNPAPVSESNNLQTAASPLVKGGKEEDSTQVTPVVVKRRVGRPPKNHKLLLAGSPGAQQQSSSQANPTAQQHQQQHHHHHSSPISPLPTRRRSRNLN